MPKNIFNYFGWEGVSFLKPADWDLSYIEGDVNKGYAVLDDGLISRVQLRWHKTGREADLDRAALKQAKVLAKKASEELDSIKVTDYKIRSFRGKKFSFDTKGAKTFYYMLQCRDCLQVVLLGVFGNKGEEIEDVCGKLLASLRDHAKDGKILWSVFGFCFRAPVELKLKEHKLTSGDLSFELCKEKDSVFFRRVSMAGSFLEDKSLNSWVVDFAAEKYANVKLENVFEDSGLRPGAVAARGREMSRFNLFKKRFFSGYFWVSEEMNSILGVVELRSAGSEMENLVPGVDCY